MKHLNEILNEAIKVETFNTNNGWGFGGAIGKIYNFKNGSYLKIAKAYYRHLKPAPFKRLIDKNGKEIFDIDTVKDSHLELLIKTIES